MLLLDELILVRAYCYKDLLTTYSIMPTGIRLLAREYNCDQNSGYVQCVLSIVTDIQGSHLDTVLPMHTQNTLFSIQSTAVTHTSTQ